MSVALSSIRRCLEGAVPALIATCAPDGTPNVVPLSQVHFVDDAHVALSYQFFSKTRQNVLSNPRAVVQVMDPLNGTCYELAVEYLRTETHGPLFESMKAKLAGIASQTGMAKVFRLLGSDVYRVLNAKCVVEGMPVTIPALPQPLSGLRACMAAMAGCPDLAQLFDAVLEGLDRFCCIQHSMLLMFDAAQARLYTAATHGYAESGVGSEIALGEGIIGVAARERTPIRIGYTASEYLYSRSLRAELAKAAQGAELETEIPFPGLADSASQLAAPLMLNDRLIGVLYVESPQELRFSYEDEDALVVLAGQLALTITLLSHAAEQLEEPATAAARVVVQGAPVTIRHFASDHSVFVGNDYLIKGVAGAILWKLLSDYLNDGRTEFTNRELRLDTGLKLPDLCDNLEARLILLQRRLAERCAFLAIEKSGRGRFRLRVDRPVLVSES
ncbi:MAG: GAF domain-containing protein [Betaproteobacteria bacterium]|nr:GAF domain-containing protein [Betaproteobacteria bacterium]